MDDPIRILIVDDHTLFRNGVKALLDTEPGMEVIGESSNGEEAVQIAKWLRPDLILMDLVMPLMDGISAITEIKNLKIDTKVLVLTNYLEDDKSISAIKAGASGYILKDCAPQELLCAIRAVYGKQTYLPPEIVNKLVNKIQEKPTATHTSLEQLTDRENEVLKLIAQGLTNEKIAVKLSISKRTVSTHLNNLLSKLHLESRAQAVIYALQNKIVDINQSPDI
jgi:two-component system, NarL family, response regulator LiaR